ncbi:DUF3413 domain-containing protein [Tolumonas lignilytica]|uniref:DUF3413 domain-containing protein n=1 Tax=Tolumonas lignilytica TaxID=1283284 RepID=UPI000464AEF0|nr:DUF3413 domain-containing protein [Tolumonas lignilytica]
MAILRPQPAAFQRDQISRLISWGHWFTFFNILLALFISSRYILANPWPETQLGVGYLVLSWLGHFSFVGFITYLLTLFPLSFLIPNQKIMRNCSVVIAVIVLSILLVDTQIYHVFKFHITPTVWDLLLKEAESKSKLNWNFLFIVIPVLFLLELVISNYAWRMQLRRRKRAWGTIISGLFVACFFLTHLTYIIADAKLYEPIISQRSNFPLSYPMTARSFLSKHGWLDLEQYQSQAAKMAELEHGKQRLHYPLQPLQVTESENKLNVLLVVVSGLRADMLQPDVMPFLSDFATKNQQFTQHIAGDNSHDGSIFSLLYGLPESYRSNVEAEGVTPLLIDELQRQDYLLSAFSTYGLNLDIYKKDVFHGVRQISRRKNDLSPSNDIQTLTSWQNWLSKQVNGRPWFSYININMPATLALPTGYSGPFQPALEDGNPFAAFTPENHDKFINRYKNAVHYSDEQLKQIVTSLQAQQSLEKTVVIITADHGLEFNETNTNSWGSGSNYSTYQMHVPFIVYWPGKTAHRWDKLSTHYDLVPTLLHDVLGADNDDKTYSSGYNLFGNQLHDWLLLGNRENYVIYEPRTITEFNRQGDFSVYTRKGYQMLDDASPNMAVLLQVMNELTRFKYAP